MYVENNKETLRVDIPSSSMGLLVIELACLNFVKASNVLINIKYKMLNNEKLSVYGEFFYQKNILFEVPFSFLLDSVFFNKF